MSRTFSGQAVKSLLAIFTDHLFRGKIAETYQLTCYNLVGTKYPYLLYRKEKGEKGNVFSM